MHLAIRVSLLLATSALLLSATVSGGGEHKSDPKSTTKSSSTKTPTRLSPPFYKVSTHQLLAERASRDAQNLANFLTDMGLANVDSYTLDHRGVSIVNEISGFDGIQIGIRDARGILAAGAVLEDDNCESILDLLGAGFTSSSARCFRHFDDPVNGRGLKGIFDRARTWAQTNPDNIWRWEKALDYYVEAQVQSDPVQRERYQLSMFRAIGQATHLIQDMCQPAHVRDDAHPIVATIETWAQANVGQVRQAIVNETGSINLASVEEYFESVGSATNSQFFSDDTIFQGYAEPSTATTFVETTPSDRFIVNSSVSSRIARQYDSVICSGGPGIPVCVPVARHSLVDANDEVMKDNIAVLAPRAVRYSRGLINHFFRGRLQVSIDSADPTQLEVTNKSAAGNALTGGQLRLFYEAVDGTRVEMDGSNGTPAVSPNSPSSLAVDESVLIAGDVPAFLAMQSSEMVTNLSVRARPDRRIVVVYSGTVGSEAGVASGRASFTSDVSLLLSFDTSGSVSQSQLNQAKTAAQTLFPILATGEDNRVAVHAFSSNAQQLVGFTDNLSTAQSAIQSLNSGGATALYDAVALAGNASVVEATSVPAGSPLRRTFVVLFTDGQRNSSSVSLGSAINAISSSTASEIEKVFLVFVGGANPAQLSSLAAQSNREFYLLQNFGDLTAVFLNAIQQ